MNDYEQTKYYVIGIAHLYLSGMSLRKISNTVDGGKLHVSIRYDLIKKLKEFDLDLWVKTMNAMEERQPDSLKKDFVKKRVLSVIYEFVKGDKTVKQLAEEFGTTEFVIYRDLTRRAPIINSYLEEPIDQNIIDKISEILTLHSENNLIPGLKL